MDQFQKWFMTYLFSRLLETARQKGVPTDFFRLELHLSVPEYL